VIDFVVVVPVNLVLPHLALQKILIVATMSVVPIAPPILVTQSLVQPVGMVNAVAIVKDVHVPIVQAIVHQVRLVIIMLSAAIVVIAITQNLLNQLHIIYQEGIVIMDVQ